jgi:hypothetical protein
MPAPTTTADRLALTEAEIAHLERKLARLRTTRWDLLRALVREKSGRGMGMGVGAGVGEGPGPGQPTVYDVPPATRAPRATQKE